MRRPVRLFGFHAVTARLRQRADSVEAIYIDASRRDARAASWSRAPQRRALPVHPVDAARIGALGGDASHQGVVAIVDAQRPHVTLDDVLENPAEPALLLVLDGVTDPHNLGACLRSADAFGAQAVIVPKDRAVGVNATVAKAASGAAETVPVVAVTNLARALRDLKERGIWVLGADAGGESLVDADVSGPIAWVLGAEGAGSAPPDPRNLRPAGRHPARRRRREPERVGRRRHLPLRVARRPHPCGRPW